MLNFFLISHSLENSPNQAITFTMRWTTNTFAAALAFATLGSCVHYTDSCSDTSLSGTTLSGHCGDNKGNSPLSSVDLAQKVGNNYGVLTWGG